MSSIVNRFVWYAGLDIYKISTAFCIGSISIHAVICKIRWDVILFYESTIDFYFEPPICHRCFFAPYNLCATTVAITQNPYCFYWRGLSALCSHGESRVELGNRRERCRRYGDAGRWGVSPSSGAVLLIVDLRKRGIDKYNCDKYWLVWKSIKVATGKKWRLSWRTLRCLVVPVQHFFIVVLLTVHPAPVTKVMRNRQPQRTAAVNLNRRSSKITIYGYICISWQPGILPVRHLRDLHPDRLPFTIAEPMTSLLRVLLILILFIKTWLNSPLSYITLLAGMESIRMIRDTFAWAKTSSPARGSVILKFERVSRPRPYNQEINTLRASGTCCVSITMSCRYELICAVHVVLFRRCVPSCVSLKDIFLFVLLSPYFWFLSVLLTEQSWMSIRSCFFFFCLFEGRSLFIIWVFIPFLEEMEGFIYRKGKIYLDNFDFERIYIIYSWLRWAKFAPEPIVANLKLNSGATAKKKKKKKKRLTTDSPTLLVSSPSKDKYGEGRLNNAGGSRFSTPLCPKSTRAAPTAVIEPPFRDHAMTSCGWNVLAR